MEKNVNPYVSVDCVLLGFDGIQLNVLVIRHKDNNDGDGDGIYKLPGSLIYMDENLDEAAQRVLRKLTGLVHVNMMQFKAFGGIDRIKHPEDSMWLKRFYNVEPHIERIVTIGYVALVRISRKMEKLETGYEAQWIPVTELPKLAFDHNEIVDEAVRTMEQASTMDPRILFKLLPRKFTAAQLRLVMESVQGVSLNIKNFHKKIASMACVVPLEEKENGVRHRAARYYTFKKAKI